MNLFTSCNEFRLRIFIGGKYIESKFADIKNISEALEIIEESRFGMYQRYKGEMTVKVDRFTGFLDKHSKKIFENDKVKFQHKTNEHGDIENITADVFWDKQSGGFAFGREDLFSFIEINDVEIVNTGDDDLTDYELMSKPKTK